MRRSDCTSILLHLLFLLSGTSLGVYGWGNPRPSWNHSCRYLYKTSNNKSYYNQRIITPSKHHQQYMSVNLKHRHHHHSTTPGGGDDDPSTARKATTVSSSLEEVDDEGHRRAKDQQQKLQWSVGAILASSFLNLLGFTMAGPITPALGKHFDLQIGASFGSLTSAYPFGMLFGLTLWPTLSDRIGRKRIMTASLLGSGLGLVAQSWVIWNN